MVIKDIDLDVNKDLSLNYLKGMQRVQTSQILSPFT